MLPLVRQRLVVRTAGAPRRQARGLSLNKNKFLEEWNGLREDTHKTWTIKSSNALTLLVAGFAIPAVCYLWARQDEFQHDKLRTAFNQPKQNTRL